MVIERDRTRPWSTERVTCFRMAGRLRRRPERREEPLEVAQAVAPVAPRVDPVIAKAAGVAPGADGVRMDAEEVGGARDSQRRIKRSRAERIQLRRLAPGDPRTVTRPILTTPHFLPMVRKYRRRRITAGRVRTSRCRDSRDAHR